MNINYKVSGKGYSTEIDVTDNHTPRSIVIHCEKDFQSKTGEKVTPAYYNDDLDIYRPSSIDVKVDVTAELVAELKKSVHMDWYSNSEIRGMF